MAGEAQGGATRGSNKPGGRESSPMAWAPGELIVAVGMGGGALERPEEVHHRVKRHVSTHCSVDVDDDDRPPVVVEHPKAGSVLFAHVVLRDKQPRAVRDAVARLNSHRGRQALRDMRLEPAGATPNWLAAAQDCVGGSPGSLPSPDPHARKDHLLRYRPTLRNLDLADQAAATTWARTGARGDGVHVAVLDTAPPDIEQRARALDNAQLRELLDAHLAPDVGRLPHARLEAARAAALAELEDAAYSPLQAPGPYPVADHGLFVASVIHAVAPWARIRLVQVLNQWGIGKLDGIIAALNGLLHAPGKKAGAPLVVNLSLGILPPMEQIPWLWHGLQVPGAPDHPLDPTLQVAPEPDDSAPRDEAWLRSNMDAVQMNLWRLQEPVFHLMSLLQAHNCLVVAAAGNDSLRRPRQDPRWQPRVPACYDSVLGVAATRREAPFAAARYSNEGDLPPLHDAVATWGGDLADDELSQDDGVIGLYTAPRLPPAPGSTEWRPNTSGWARWSGTSFATPIMTGVALNLWAMRLGAPSDDATATLAAVNAAVRGSESSFVPGLNVPPVPIAAPEWHTMGSQARQPS